MISSARWAAYFELTKPRISTMVLITIVVSAWLASHGTSTLLTLLNVGIGMFLVAASGNAANMYLERYSDFLMTRTAKRPLPDQRLSSNDVTRFSAITFGIGLPYLWLTCNWQTFVCALITWILYVFVYTPSKRITHLNTEIGAIAGAMPVACGALAAIGGMEAFSWGLFAMLLFWQFPHFMAIAWLYRNQYANGGLRMLTVTEPTGSAAGRKAIIMGVLTGLASLLPLLAIESVSAKIVFAMISVFLAFFYVYYSIHFANSRDDANARRLLRYSILYLPLYMVLLIVFNRS